MPNGQEDPIAKAIAEFKRTKQAPAQQDGQVAPFDTGRGISPFEDLAPVKKKVSGEPSVPTLPVSGEPSQPGPTEFRPIDELAQQGAITVPEEPTEEPLPAAADIISPESEPEDLSFWQEAGLRLKKGTIDMSNRFLATPGFIKNSINEVQRKMMAGLSYAIPPYLRDVFEKRSQEETGKSLDELIGDFAVSSAPSRTQPIAVINDLVLEGKNYINYDEIVGGEQEKINNDLAEYDRYIYGDKSRVDMLKNGDYLLLARKISTDLAEQVPVIAGIALTRNAGGIPAVTARTLTGGAVFGAGKYEQIQDEEISEPVKLFNAWTTGVAEMLSEELGTGVIMSAGRKILQQSGKEAAKRFFNGTFFEISKKGAQLLYPVGAASREALSEAAAQFAENAVDKITIDPDRSLTEGLAEVALTGAGVGASISAPVSAAAILNGQRKQRLVDKQRLNDQMVETVLNPETSDVSKEILLNEIEANNTDMISDLEAERNEQGNYTEAQRSRAEEITTRLDSLDVVLRDETVPETVKPNLQLEFNQLQTELDGINEEVLVQPEGGQADDTQNQTGVRGSVGERQETVEAQPEQVPGREEISPGRAIQKTEAEEIVAEEAEPAEIPLDVQTMTDDQLLERISLTEAPAELAALYDAEVNNPQTGETPAQNPRLEQINTRYVDITGKKLNRKTAKSIAEEFQGGEQRRAEPTVQQPPEQAAEQRGIPEEVLQGQEPTVPEAPREERPATEPGEVTAPEEQEIPITFSRFGEQQRGVLRGEQVVSERGTTYNVTDVENVQPVEAAEQPDAQTQEPAEAVEEEQAEGPVAERPPVPSSVEPESEAQTAVEEATQESTPEGVADNVWDRVFDQTAVRPVIRQLEKLKIKGGGLQTANPLAVVWNTAIDAVEAAIRAGNTVRNAINEGIRVLKENGFSDQQQDYFRSQMLKGIEVNPDAQADPPPVSEAKNSVYTELNSIRDQYRASEDGRKQGLKEGKITQKEAADARRKEIEEIRDKLMQSLNKAVKSGLFKGYKTSQNSVFRAAKKVLQAGDSPRRLTNLFDYIGNVMIDLNYQNKVDYGRRLSRSAWGVYIPGSAKSVAPFLRIDPLNVPAGMIDQYISSLETLVSGKRVPANVLNNITKIANEKAEAKAETRGVSRKQRLFEKGMIDPDDVEVVPIPEKPIGTFTQRLSEGFETFRRNWLDFRKGLSKDMHAMFEQTQGRIKVEMERAQRTTKRLENVITPENTETIDAALRGDQSAVGQLSPEIQDIIGEMRGHISRIQAMLINKGLVTPAQSIIIEESMGEYITRGYQLFENPNWTLENVPQEIQDKAFGYLYKQHYANIFNESPDKTHEEIQEQASNLAQADINTIFTEADKSAYAKAAKMGRKDVTILGRRQEIAEPIRMLMGEITDPATNYAHTIFRISNLAHNAQNLANIRNRFYGELFFEKNDPNRTPEFDTLIAGEASETMNPLNGLYTTKEIAQAFEMEPQQLNDFTTAYLKSIGLVRAGKTIGSPVTHVKNITGNFGFVMGNGHFNFSKFTDAIEVARNDISKKSKKEVNEIIDTMIELGAFNQNVGLGVIRDGLNREFRDRAGFNNAIDRLRGSRVGRAIWGLAEGGAKLYEAEDNVFKVYAFLNDRKRYSNAFYSKPYNELNDAQKRHIDEYVAELVKNHYPTYSRVAPISRIGSRYLPAFGNFVAFQSEAIRVQYNLMATAIREIRSDNSKIRSIGAKRLAGIAAYESFKVALLALAGTAGKYGLNGMAGLLYNDDNEDEYQRAYRRFVAPWAQNSSLITLPERNGEMRYVDFSSHDPFGTVASSMNALLNGETPIDGAHNAIVNIIEPFLGPEISFNILINLYNGTDDYGRDIYFEDDPYHVVVAKSLAYALKQAQPGITASIGRIAKSDEKVNELTAFVYRTYKADVAQQFRFRLLERKKRIDDFKKRYYRYRYKKGERENLLPAFEGKIPFRVIDDEAIEEYRNEINNKIADEMREAWKDYEAAYLIGGTAANIERVVNESRLTKSDRARVRTGLVDVDFIK